MSDTMSIYDRLAALIENGFDGQKPRWTNRGLCRTWLASVIGCQPGTLSSNFKLRRMIREWEGRNREEPRPEEDPVEAANDNVIPLRRRERLARIVWATVKLYKHIWSIPTIVSRSGEQQYNDWFRYLVVKMKREPTSVDENAKHIRQFLKFCGKLKIALRDVDDEVLITWREELRAAGTKMPRRNTLLRTMHAFFRWAAQENIFRYIVQIERPSSYPESMLDYVFPISSEEVMVITSRGNKRFHWVWPFLETGSAARYGRRHTPTFEEIDRIYAFTDVQKHGIRNVLMMNWALRTGARVSEVLSITLEDLPTETQYEEMIERDQWIIKLKKRKWKKDGGVLYVPADLIWDTLNYIENERKRIVTARGSKGGHAVFLSERGTPIVADSVTKVCNSLFNAARVVRANIHRLRARFAHNVVEIALNHLERAGVTLDPTSGWHETALIIAAEMMGHSSPRSLEPYLHDILFRRAEIVRLKGQGVVITVHQDREAENERIVSMGLEIGNLIRAGKEVEARKVARHISNTIDRRLLWQDPVAMAA
ncbi:tyrosine-type recombinase/integrase [Rhizobium leguminosarum]|uniref:tyrosine-type recombinase/integrase n=1 Tax=Rhizobium leguminosarum TaxID=384 RepID=UPI00102FF95A|nr:site-specific integrase [Rhizobium leguminosarum]TAY99677.1 site-specific integrase [Rhizobium leguminosarum]TAZ10547.1 site-specific integrase [Rhizobium leguminosarum]